VKIDEAIEKNYNVWLSTISCILPEEWANDVMHEVLVTMLEKRNVEYKCVDCYVIRACMRAYKQVRGIAGKLGCHDNKTSISDIDDGVFDEDFDDDEEVYNNIDVWRELEIAPLSWWEKEVFKRKVLEGKSFRKLAAETNIKTYMVFYTYKKVIKVLKSQIYGKEKDNRNGR